MSFNKEEAKKMLEFLTEEQTQAKMRCLAAGFDCTSARMRLLTNTVIILRNTAKYCV
jgi:hypothetical protein